MEHDDGERALRAAGAAAVRWNCPLDGARADVLVDFIASVAPPLVIDIGCGQGELLHRIVEESPSTHGLGLDLDAAVITQALGRAGQAGVGDRLSFQVGDARDWTNHADAALCIGSEEAFGDLGQLYAGIAAIVPTGRAVVGAGFWADDPNDWGRAVFGDLPLGLDELSSLPVTDGWSVVHASESTLDEWDAFEGDWTDGIRQSGLEGAEEYATTRAADYGRYRGVLGFGWLQLER